MTAAAGIKRAATMTEAAAQGAVPATPVRVKVWDPLVRVFHWGLVGVFAVAWLSAEDLSTVHEIAGYGVAGLVAFRVFWGLLGSRYARFAQFLKGPAATIAYLRAMMQRKERRYLGHNPAGAAMIVALLIALSGTGFTGWLSQEPDRLAMLPDMPQIVSPVWADGDNDDTENGDSALKDVHEVFANLLLLLVALHVGGVVLASIRHRENLVASMMTGTKRAPQAGDVA